MDLVTTSGAKVVINQAPFADVARLHRAVMRDAALMGGQINMAMVLMSLGSEAIDALVWPCLARCTYNDQKIIKETFDPVDARRDYYEILAAFAEVNIVPLVESLRSQLHKHGLVKAQGSTVKSPDSELMTKSPSSL